MRIEADIIDHARNTDLAALVGQRVKLVRRGRALWGCCPFHREKSPSFKIEGAHFYCFGCGAHGDSIEWLKLTSGMNFRDAVEALTDDNIPRAPFSIQHAADYEHQDNQRRISEARALWERGLPIQGSHAEKYLRTRGITDPCNPSLRFIEQFEYMRGIMLPVMVAALLSSDRQITACQVTFLNLQKLAKANVATPRRTIGVMGAGAVRLAKANEVLGLAEGIETALSAMQMTGVPTWACLGAARMHRGAIPYGVKELHLFHDNDNAGREAAKRTAEAHSGLHIVMAAPPIGKDWNNALQASLPEVNAA